MCLFLYNGKHQWINFFGQFRQWQRLSMCLLVWLVVSVLELKMKFKRKSVKEIACLLPGPFSFLMFFLTWAENKKYEVSCTMEVFEILYLRKLQHGALKTFMSTLCQPYCGFLCSMVGVSMKLPLEPQEAQQGTLAAQLRYR